LKQDQVVEEVCLVHNTSMEDRTKVYVIPLLTSYICEATSWHLTNYSLCPKISVTNWFDQIS
jgi:hypothetical protein